MGHVSLFAALMSCAICDTNERTLKKNAGLLGGSKDVSLKGNTKKNKFMSRPQNSGQMIG